MTRMRLYALAFAVLFCGGLACGVVLDRWWTTPKVEVVTRDHVTTVTVDKPVLQTRDMLKYVTDQTEVSRLLSEQHAAQRQIATLTETIASLKASGAGTITYVDRPVPGTNTVSHEAHFKDWRLTFDAVDASATYSLSQRFEAITAVGKDAAGKPTAAVRLFEIGPAEKRTSLSDMTTTVISANPSAPRWRVSPAVQAGLGYGWTSLSAHSAGAVVGLQWLKRGMSRAAEDNTWAAITPVLVITAARVEPGLLPASVNLGRLKHSPFSDLWLSPLLTPKRVGLSLTATF